jgi:hypothetical protein
VLVALACALYAKFSVLYLGPCFLAGLLSLPATRRKLLNTPLSFWLIAIAVVMPLVYWQYTHNWPFVAHMAVLTETQLVNQAPFQSFFELPLLFLAGIFVFLFGLMGSFSKSHKTVFIPLFIGWVFTCIFLGFSGAKNYYYATPTIGLLLIGSLQVEAWANTLFKRGVVWAATAGLVGFSISLFPILLVALPAKQEAAYMSWAQHTAAL